MVESIQLANAQRVRIIAEAQIKTDKLDARHLAWLLRADLIPAIHIPPPETRHPYVRTEKVILRGIKTASGKPLLVSEHDDMLKAIQIGSHALPSYKPVGLP